ncbi:MAG: hypothetical protein QM709_14955 [Spongiibacteraceae bacterium]
MGLWLHYGLDRFTQQPAHQVAAQLQLLLPVLYLALDHFMGIVGDTVENISAAFGNRFDDGIFIIFMAKAIEEIVGKAAL